MAYASRQVRGMRRKTHTPEAPKTGAYIVCRPAKVEAVAQTR